MCLGIGPVVGDSGSVNAFNFAPKLVRTWLRDAVTGSLARRAAVAVLVRCATASCPVRGGRSGAPGGFMLRVVTIVVEGPKKWT